MKNKILFISIIFILLSFIFINNNVFATETVLTTTLPSIDKIVNSGDNWFIWYKQDVERYTLYVTDGNITYLDKHYNGTIVDDGYFMLFDNCSYIKRYYYVKGDNNWSFNQEYGEALNLTVPFHVAPKYSVNPIEDICASNIDICYDEETGRTDLVFQKSLTLSRLKGMNFQQTVWETFQTMICGIIPYLIALVVGLVAFWKVWQLLLKELRKA